MKTFNINCPFFPGFYESTLLNSGTEYDAINDTLDFLFEQGRITGSDYHEEDFEFDYVKYKEDVCDAFVKAFYKYTPDMVSKVTMTGLSSPQYYNYSTDELQIDVTVEDGWEHDVEKFINDNYDWLEWRIRQDWSDRDGFWSFLSNKVDDWYDKITVEGDDTYFGVMLGYMMLREQGKVVGDSIIYDALDDIYTDSYVIYPESLKKKLENHE